MVKETQITIWLILGVNPEDAVLRVATWQPQGLFTVVPMEVVESVNHCAVQSLPKEVKFIEMLMVEAHTLCSWVIGVYGWTPLPLDLPDYNGLIAHDGSSSAVGSHCDSGASNVEGISLIAAGSEGTLSTEVECLYHPSVHLYLERIGIWLQNLMWWRKLSTIAPIYLFYQKIMRLRRTRSFSCGWQIWNT